MKQQRAERKANTLHNKKLTNSCYSMLLPTRHTMGCRNIHLLLCDLLHGSSGLILCAYCHQSVLCCILCSMLNSLHARLVPHREHSLSYTGVLFTYSHKGIICRRIGTGHYIKNDIRPVRWAIPFWRVRLTMAINE